MSSSPSRNTPGPMCNSALPQWLQGPATVAVATAANNGNGGSPPDAAGPMPSLVVQVTPLTSNVTRVADSLGPVGPPASSIMTSPTHLERSLDLAAATSPVTSADTERHALHAGPSSAMARRAGLRSAVATAKRARVPSEAAPSCSSPAQPRAKRVGVRGSTSSIAAASGSAPMPTPPLVAPAPCVGAVDRVSNIGAFC
jgi:hypothetical protein